MPLRLCALQLCVRVASMQQIRIRIGIFFVSPVNKKQLRE